MLLPGILSCFVSIGTRALSKSSNASTSLVRRSSPCRDSKEQCETISRLIEKDFMRWREDIDSDIESIFLHIWRYFRLDTCLHSTDHVSVMRIRISHFLL